MPKERAEKTLHKPGAVTSNLVEGSKNEGTQATLETPRAYLQSFLCEDWSYKWVQRRIKELEASSHEEIDSEQVSNTLDSMQKSMQNLQKNIRGCLADNTRTHPRIISYFNNLKRFLRSSACSRLKKGQEVLIKAIEFELGSISRSLHTKQIVTTILAGIAEESRLTRTQKDYLCELLLQSFSRTALLEIFSDFSSSDLTTYVDTVFRIIQDWVNDTDPHIRENTGSIIKKYEKILHIRGSSPQRSIVGNAQDIIRQATNSLLPHTFKQRLESQITPNTVIQALVHNIETGGLLQGGGDVYGFRADKATVDRAISRLIEKGKSGELLEPIREILPWLKLKWQLSREGITLKEKYQQLRTITEQSITPEAFEKLSKKLELAEELLASCPSLKRIYIDMDRTGKPAEFGITTLPKLD